MIADALLLAHSLYRDLRRDAIERTLAQPLLVPSPAEVPSWLHVKHYIEHHPEFLDTADLRAAWRASVDSSADRVRLVREFTSAVTGQKGRGVQLLSPRLSKNGTALSRVSKNIDAILKALAEPGLRYTDRRQQLISILVGRK